MILFALFHRRHIGPAPPELWRCTYHVIMKPYLAIRHPASLPRPIRLTVDSVNRSHNRKLQVATYISQWPSNPNMLPRASSLSRITSFRSTTSSCSSHSLVNNRSFSSATSPLAYAGPRTSRSFRRSRNETPGAQNLGPRIESDNSVGKPYMLPRRTALFGHDMSALVNVQHDAKGILKETDGAMNLLSNSALVVVRSVGIIKTS
jgi:hypothetical protein